MNILSFVFERKFSSHMNIFGWYFLMHVLERKNEESFDLVEFVASVNQVNFAAHFPSNRRFF